MNDLYNSLSKLFPYSTFEPPVMSFSNKLKDGKPNIWEIDDHIYSLKLEIIDKNINIIALTNQVATLGFATNAVNIIHDFAYKNKLKIFIINDESAGYWKKIIEKYDDNIISIK